MSRAKDIPLYDSGLFIRRACWPEGYSIAFSETEQCWQGHREGNRQAEEVFAAVLNDLFSKDDWEPYRAPKEKKRFWLWDLQVKRNAFVALVPVYFDDKGKASDGSDFRNHVSATGVTSWDKLPFKRKREADFIEV